MLFFQDQEHGTTSFSLLHVVKWYVYLLSVEEREVQYTVPCHPSQLLHDILVLSYISSNIEILILTVVSDTSLFPGAHSLYDFLMFYRILGLSNDSAENEMLLCLADHLQSTCAEAEAVAVGWVGDQSIVRAAIRGVECRWRRWVLQSFVHRTGLVFVTSNNLLYPVRTFSLDLHTASTVYCIVEDSRINNRSHLVQPNIRYKLALADSSQIAA